MSQVARVAALRRGALAAFIMAAALAAACSQGGKQASPQECASGVSLNGVCAPPTCEDQVKNGYETDVDCGGGSCGKCADALVCSGANDCASGVCTGARCAAPTCTDGVKNGAETGLDCGGGCTGCADGQLCAAPADCASGVCADQHCAPPACADQVKNGAETDVDCGGGTCSACADGLACAAGGDCAAGVCGTDGKCAVPSCTDAVANGTETDVDCGGDCTDRCGDLAGCVANGDCASGVCKDGACQVATCTDTVENGSETGPDCGGTCATKCPVGTACMVGPDCVTGSCVGEVCQAPGCTDGVKNGAETDVDCGATCPNCADGKACLVAGDCDSSVCTGNVCKTPSCIDGVRNGDESDVDCGNGICPACDVNKTCTVNASCISKLCVGDRCAMATCTDTVKNGAETDVDCGGGSCAKCGTAKLCASPSDCVSSVCTGGLCQAPSCTDRVKNGTEAAVDCGGSCPLCAAGTECTTGTWCQSKLCCTTGTEGPGCVGAGLCSVPLCNDLVQNGTETAVDCGGTKCAKCDDGKTCTASTDCTSGYCQGTTSPRVCRPATCGNNAKDGTESDVDCGGACNPCQIGQACSGYADCASLYCALGVCDIDPSGSCPLVYTWDGTYFRYTADAQGEVIGLPPAWAISQNTELFGASYIELPRAALDDDGRLQLRIRETLAEISYLDEALLVAVDHPAGTRVLTSRSENTYHFGYVNDFQVYTLAAIRAPLRATTEAGFQVLGALAYADGVPAPAPTDAAQYFELDFGPIARPEHAKLLLDAWTVYGAPRPVSVVQPSVEAETSSGWTTVARFGTAAGETPKTIVVPLALPPGATGRLRVHLGMRVDASFVVDRVALDDSAPAAVELKVVEPASAILSERGALTYVRSRLDAAMTASDDVKPLDPRSIGWGDFTRVGDVRDLVTAADDLFVVMRHGDQIALSYEPPAPFPASGYTRTYFLRADVFYKVWKIDPSQRTTDPMPFHGMSSWPYPSTESYPADATHEAYRKAYNTRRYTP